MSTLIQDYELLVRYLEEMIDDGCQLVHGGNLFDWNDTKITNILKKIKKGKAGLKTPTLKPGVQLKHRVSGQRMTVTEVNKETVSLIPDDSPITYPLAHISEAFEVLKKSKK